MYNWEALRRTGYRWCIDRLRALLAHVDVVRLDHFRGFAAAWYVPMGAPTARLGQWSPGPGSDFFQAAKKELGTLPLIAEDLGVITPDVAALRDQFDIPGTRVLQFAFDRAPIIRICRATTFTTAWSIRARTTTTRRAAGSKPDGPTKANALEVHRASARGQLRGCSRVAAPGLVVVSRPGDGSPAGCTQPARLGAYERTRPGRGQLAMAGDGRYALPAAFGSLADLTRASNRSAVNMAAAATVPLQETEMTR